MLVSLNVRISTNTFYPKSCISHRNTISNWHSHMPIPKNKNEILLWIFTMNIYSVNTPLLHCQDYFTNFSLFFWYYTLDVENTHGILDMWKDGACNLWNLGIDFTWYFMTILINSNESCSFFLRRVFNLILSNACINGPRKVGA